MVRLMMIGVVCSMVVAGGCKKNTLPDPPKPVNLVQLIEIPNDLGDSAHETEWTDLVEYFNSVTSSLNMTAANIQELGDAATGEMKSLLSEAETSLKAIRSDVMGVRTSGNLNAIQSKIEEVSEKIVTIKSMIVP